MDGAWPSAFDAFLKLEHRVLRIARQGESGRASSDFPNPVPEVTPQKGPKSHAIGVSDARRDLFYTFGGRFQEVHRAFHAQFLEIR
jgi:hypothetical protein